MNFCRPEFQDDPHEIAEQVWYTYEEEDDKDSIEPKKEEIPITLWMCKWTQYCMCVCGRGSRGFRCCIVEKACLVHRRPSASCSL